MTRRPEAYAGTLYKPDARTLAAGLLCILATAAWPARAQVDEPWRMSYGDDRVAATTSADDELVPEFARVRYTEGGLSADRETGYAVDLAFNAAVYRGDRLRTDGRQRAEIQLPDGSLVRLDRRTLVEIQGLFGPQRDADAETVLALYGGRVQIDAPRPDRGERFRVDTPSATIYPLQPSAFRVDVLEDDEVIVVVQSGEVEVSGARGSELLVTGEVTRVYAGDAPRRPRRAGPSARDSFDHWVARRDDVYRLRDRPGREYASLPEEVRPYYGELSHHGEWAYDDGYGSVWVPSVEDDWAPYRQGYWDPGPYGPVWISSEPWGWPVYRYGRWDFSIRFGWVWIPGHVFRPAHVAWYYGPSYVGWCPLGFYNNPVYVSFSFGWGHRYFHHSPWVFSGYRHFYHHGSPYIHHLGHRHASAVRRELHRGDGVVTRAVLHRDDVTRTKVRQRNRPEGLPADTYTRAGRLAERRDLRARPVRSLEGQGDRTAAAKARRSFRDEEDRLRGKARPSSRTAQGRDLREPPPGVRTDRVRPDRRSVDRSDRDRANRRSDVRRDGRAVPRRGRGSAPAESVRPDGTKPGRRPVIRVVPGGDESARTDRATGDRSRTRERSDARESGRSARGRAPYRGSTKAAPAPVAPRRHAERPSAAERGGRDSVKDSVRRFFGRVGRSERSGDATTNPRRRPERAAPDGRDRPRERSPEARPRAAPRRESASRPERRSRPSSADRPSGSSRPQKARPSRPAPGSGGKSSVRRPSGRSGGKSSVQRPSGRSGGKSSVKSRSEGSSGKSSVRRPSGRSGGKSSVKSRSKGSSGKSSVRRPSSRSGGKSSAKSRSGRPSSRSGADKGRTSKSSGKARKR